MAIRIGNESGAASQIESRGWEGVVIENRQD
jgi:hypothetical protein